MQLFFKLVSCCYFTTFFFSVPLIEPENVPLVQEVVGITSVSEKMSETM